MTARKAHAARMAKLKAAAAAVVAKGVCPQCGTKLVRNLALAGWWQCGGFGSEGFRKPGFESVAHCDFQTFTE